MLDRDMPFPTPKELARNINEVLPTEKHLEEIYYKIDNKHGGRKLDLTLPYPKFNNTDFVNDLKKELAADLFKHAQHDLRNS